jgi:serine/threonine protein kinase
MSHFDLGQRIGSGKFGDVHLCRHKVTHTLFALKKILKSTIIELKLLEQFTNELKIQYRLDHPNIVKLYAHFDDEYHIFLLMEYAPGGTLMEKINNTERYTAGVMEQMLKAV